MNGNRSNIKMFPNLTFNEVDILYSEFRSRVEYLSNQPVWTYKTISYIEMYSEFYSIFNKCRNAQLPILNDMCFKYLQDECAYLLYPKLYILSHVLLYFRKNHAPVQQFFNDALRESKRKSRTLMELCLLKVEQTEHLRRKLNVTVRENVKKRIKTYDFQ